MRWCRLGGDLPICSIVDLAERLDRIAGRTTPSIDDNSAPRVEHGRDTDNSAGVIDPRGPDPFFASERPISFAGSR
jgi:hypothetical protein